MIHLQGPSSHLGTLAQSCRLYQEDWLEKESSFSASHSYLVLRAREINAKCLRITGVAFWTEGNGVEVNMAVADVSQNVFQETVIPRVHPISPHQNVWILRQARMARIPSLTVGESRTSTSPEFWEVPKKPWAADLGQGSLAVLRPSCLFVNYRTLTSSVSIKWDSTVQVSSHYFSILFPSCNHGPNSVVFSFPLLVLREAGTHMATENCKIFPFKHAFLGFNHNFVNKTPCCVSNS